ncbi:MAG: CHAT domain-containing protein [Vulcanimicrobiota bacterium]
MRRLLAGLLAWGLAGAGWAEPPLERVRRLLAFRRYEQARSTLRALQPHLRSNQERFDWLLLQDQLQQTLGEPSDRWLERAALLVGGSDSNRLRLDLRRYRSLRSRGLADHAERAGFALEREWRRAPVPALACDYFLARADWFSTRREDRGEEQNLEQAQVSAYDDSHKAAVAQAVFMYNLNHSRWEEAEDEVERYAERTGPPGALVALWMQAQLANRQGRTRLAQGLFLHLADLERAAHEPYNEAQYLFWTLDIEKSRKKSDRSVAFGSERLQKRLWELTDRLPVGSIRLSQLLSLSRVCGSQKALIQARAVYARLPWSSQQTWFAQMASRLESDGHLEEALQLCDQALKHRPNWQAALSMKGRIRERQGDLPGAQDYYVRGLKAGGSEVETTFLAGSLLSLLRDQNRSQELLRVTQEITRAQTNPRLRSIFLQRGLMGSPASNSLPDQRFRQWCWQELAGLLDSLDDDAQLEAALALSYKPPQGSSLAAVLQRGLELTRRYREVQEREQNWARYARVCQARSTLLEAGGRSAEAMECLLEAESKLVAAQQPAALDSLRESLMWLQSRAGQKEHSEATALKLLETITERGRRAELWMQVAVCREARPEAALQAYAEALREASDPVTRQRIVLFECIALGKLERWQSVIDRLQAGPAPAGWMERSRGQMLANAYEKLGQFDAAERALSALVAGAKGYSVQDQVQNLSDLAEFLRRNGRPGAAELVEQGYRDYVDQVSGPPRFRLIRAYCLQLLDQGKAAQALKILQDRPLPTDALGPLAKRSELAEWLAGQAAAATIADPVADFRQTLARIHTVRRDLDAHPLFQAGQLELLQQHLNPQQILLTVCQAGPQLFVLGVDKERTYVYESALEGSWYSQQLADMAVSPEARGYLNKRLIDPIQPWLRDREILWAPLDEGWYYPWEMLGPSQGEPLGLSCSFTRMGSADLLHLAGGQWQPFRLGDSLALGAPPEVDLAGARRELQSIAARLPGCRLALGVEARVEALAPAPSLIHIASHSQIMGQDPDASYVQFHAVRLSLRDVYRLSLQPHSLVVLSSCSSALGQNRPGGEPLSLAGAFAAAGSQAQISALWPVDDGATALFFEAFYERLAEGNSPGRSLLGARRFLADRGYGPRDWAAFVLQGCPD